MSLINDALKQAGKAQKENPPPPSPLQFRAAEPLPRRSYSPPAVLFAVLLVVLVLGGLLVAFALQMGRTPPQVVNARQPANPATVATLPAIVATPVAIEPPTPTASASSASPTATPNPVTDVSATATASNAPVAIAPVEPPKPAAPKLQGISYNPARPSAVISGRTVYVGDRVVGFNVTKITKDAVTLSNGAETKVLSLSD